MPSVKRASGALFSQSVALVIAIGKEQTISDERWTQHDNWPSHNRIDRREFLSVFGTRVTQWLTKHDRQPSTETGPVECRLRYGALGRPRDQYEFSEQDNAELLFICEHGQHSNGVDPQQSDNGSSVNCTHVPSSRLFVDTIIGVVWLTTAVKPKQFHAGQQRTKAVFYRHLAFWRDLVTDYNSFLLLSANIDSRSDIVSSSTSMTVSTGIVYGRTAIIFNVAWTRAGITD